MLVYFSTNNYFHNTLFNVIGGVELFVIFASFISMCANKSQSWNKFYINFCSVMMNFASILDCMVKFCVVFRVMFWVMFCSMFLCHVWFSFKKKLCIIVMSCLHHPFCCCIIFASYLHHIFKYYAIIIWINIFGLIISVYVSLDNKR